MHPPTRRQGDHERRNANYERDIAYVTKQSKWILKSIGIWPAMLNGTAKFLSKIAIGISSFVLLFAIVPCILYILYEEKDTIMRLKLCGLLCFCVTSLLKYWALTVRKPTIENCIEEVRIDWKQVEIQRDREMMLKFGRTGRNLTILCAVFMYSGGAIYHTIMPQYAIGTLVDEHNRTIKPLVYPTYSVLFDAQTSPVYELVYVLHCMCGYVIYSVTAGACGLAALFATHTCGQIDIIVSRLNKLTHGDPAKGRSTLDARLIEIVERHLRVLRFSAKIEMVLQEVCFLEFISSAFIICLVEYYCLTDWKQSNTISLTTYMILLVSLTFNIFILCYIGELLIEKSSSIGMCCFMIDWVQLPTKTIHGLILIIAMSNSPAKITAGKIVDLSLFTFGNILKTSLAYLSFFRTTVI
ncbi:odorant receptor 4-like [Xylocopa sonorina]|uniref:odorant receptor 4-like n=1 Tax=Xylocopa sonorina TaxID=1818115 RepID=UPI00403AEB58